MTRASEIHRLSDSLFVWQAYDRAVKADLSSTAIRTGDGLVLIDPVALDPEPLAGLVAGAAPAAILLTNANHARAAAAFRDEFSIPVAAHADACASLEIKPDDALSGASGEIRGLAFRRIPGAPSGEIALHFPHDGGVVVIGDAIINLESHGFAFLPDKYCANPREMRTSLRQLGEWRFTTITFAHGTPVVSNAKSRFQNLLAEG